MNDSNPNELFDANYYATGCGTPYVRNDEWLDVFDKIATQIVAKIAPTTVLDAGCAMGFLVEQLRARGVDAEGIDISAYAISQAHPSIQPFVRVGSVAEPLERRYDLIVCIEVLEHMPRAEAEQAIAAFCQASDDILFSSSPDDYKEPTHFNVNPAEYWAEIFATHGFIRDVDFDASFITAWAVRFRRTSEPLPRIIRDFERRFTHLWQEITDLRTLTVELRASTVIQDERINLKEQELSQSNEYINNLIQNQAQQANQTQEYINGLIHQANDFTQQIADLNQYITHQANDFTQQIADLNQRINHLVAQEAELTQQLAFTQHQNRLLRQAHLPDLTIRPLLEAMATQQAEQLRLQDALAHQQRQIVWLESIINSLEYGRGMTVIRRLQRREPVQLPSTQLPRRATAPSVTAAGGNPPQPPPIQTHALLADPQPTPRQAQIIRWLQQDHLTATMDREALAPMLERVAHLRYPRPGIAQQPRNVLICDRESGTHVSSRWLVELAGYLVAQGYQVTLATPIASQLAWLMSERGIHAQAVPYLETDILQTAILLYDYDLVFVQGVASYRAILAAAAIGLPSVWSIHETQAGCELLRRQSLAHESMTHASAVIFPTRAIQALYTGLVPDLLAYTLPVGIPHPADPIPTVARVGSRLSIVMPLAIQPEHGQDLLLAALHGLPPDVRQQCECYLIGEVRDQAFYAQLLHQMVGLDHVYVTGPLSYEQTLQCLMYADIVLCTPRDPALPLFWLHAMAYGKALLATHVSGIAETVTHGSEALLVPPGDAAALATHLAALIEQPDLRVQLGAAAQLRYQAYHTLNGFGGTLTALWNNLWAHMHHDRSVHVLLVSTDVVGAVMAGPGIRAFELARVLAGFYRVTLAVPEGSKPPSTPCHIFTYQPGQPNAFSAMLATVDVIIGQGFVFQRHPELLAAPQPLAVDLYDPEILEILHMLANVDPQTATTHAAVHIAQMERQLQRGDFFFCATERQRDYWLGSLSALGRVTPTLMADVDPELRKLIDLVPSGIAATPPHSDAPVLRTIHPAIPADALLLVWAGGLWEWFDPQIIVRAVATLRDECPRLRLCFFAGARPNPHGMAVATPTAQKTRELAAELGVLDQTVIMLEQWVPYAERGRYLLEADFGVSAHLPGIETRFSFRTRLLDYIWARLPIIVSAGDSLADQITAIGGGCSIAPGDLEGWCTTIRTLYHQAERRQTMVVALDELARGFTWEEVAQPLVDFCTRPQRQMSGKLSTEALTVHAPPQPILADTTGHEYIQQLETALELKNQHIGKLEELLHRIEGGRLMRMLRVLRVR